MQTKLCSHCKQEKPFSAFSINKYHKDGLSSECKRCKNELHKQYRKEHPKLKDKMRLNMAKWRETHREYERMKARELYYKHKLEVFQIISGLEKPCCVNCGCDDFRFLEINHKNGGGQQEIKSGRATGHFYRAIRTGKRKTNDLEVTCRVCNALHYLELKYGKTGFVVIWSK